jgi:predicted glycoside hydrolase/deacetylase ChbG (UPF0249 family)
MPCVEGVGERLRQWGPQISGSIGVHLQLTSGKPRSSLHLIKSLLDGDSFPSEVPAVERLDLDEVEREWTAQIEAVLESGLSVTHLDSHHGLHRYDRLIGIYIRLAQRFGLAARGGKREICAQLVANGVSTTDLCDSRWIRGDLTVPRFLELVLDDFSQLQGDGTVEMVTHPGFVDDDLHRITRYSEPRGRELAVLCSEELLDGIRQNGIEIVSFRELQR